MVFRPLDVGSSALLRSLPCPLIALAQIRALCVVSTPSNVQCHLQSRRGISEKSIVKRMLPLAIASAETALTSWFNELSYVSKCMYSSYPTLSLTLLIYKYCLLEFVQLQNSRPPLAHTGGLATESN